MNIQQNLNQVFSLAGLLFSQTSGAKAKATKEASEKAAAVESARTAARKETEEAFEKKQAEERKKALEASLTGREEEYKKLVQERITSTKALPYTREKAILEPYYQELEEYSKYGYREDIANKMKEIAGPLEAARTREAAATKKAQAKAKLVEEQDRIRGERNG